MKMKIKKIALLLTMFAMTVPFAYLASSRVEKVPSFIGFGAMVLVFVLICIILFPEKYSSKRAIRKSTKVLWDRR